MDEYDLRKKYDDYCNEFDKKLKSGLKPPLNTIPDIENRLGKLSYTVWLLEQVLLSLRKTQP